MIYKVFLYYWDPSPNLGVSFILLIIIIRCYIKIKYCNVIYKPYNMFSIQFYGKVFYNNSIIHYYKTVIISQMVLLSEDPCIISQLLPPWGKVRFE